jgi:hypothetical protein
MCYVLTACVAGCVDGGRHKSQVDSIHAGRHKSCLLTPGVTSLVY